MLWVLEEYKSLHGVARWQRLVKKYSICFTLASHSLPLTQPPTANFTAAITQASASLKSRSKLFLNMAEDELSLDLQESAALELEKTDEASVFPFIHSAGERRLAWYVR